MRVASMLLAVSTGVLVSLGLVAMISSEVEIGWRSAAGSQVVFCGLGLWLAAVVAMFDYRWLKHLAWPAFLVAVGLLVAVLIWGSPEFRAMRWFRIESLGLTFQPSEFAKLALILLLAWYGERFQRVMPTWWRGFVVPGLLIGVVLALLILEPDWGTMILLGGVSGAMLLVAGVRWLHLFPAAAFCVGILALLLVQDENRIVRVLDWWNPAPDSPTREQVEEAKMALGSGGLLGRGPGQGEHYGRVPLVRSDFILALIGEEFGLLGTVSVVLAFALFLVSGILVAWNARDTFGLLLASGLTLLIAMQAMINIGVVIDVLPNKGIALPFLSKGGSNLVVMLSMVGLLFSVARTTARERVAEQGPVADFEELGALGTS